jgi:hypothetical protein
MHYQSRPPIEVLQTNISSRVEYAWLKKMAGNLAAAICTLVDAAAGRLRPLSPARTILLRFYISNHEFVDRVTCLESGSQPPRLFTTP